MIRRLQRGDVALAISLFHMVEFSHPAFRSYPVLRDLLNDIPTVLANPFQEVEEDEFAVACAAATGRSRRPPRVFAADTSRWGIAGGPIGGTALDMIESFSRGPSRDQIVAMAHHGADTASRMKGQAAVVRDPQLPLRLAVERHLLLHRESYRGYADGLESEEIIRRTQEWPHFAGYRVHEALLAVRLRDSNRKDRPGDVFDEFNAFYAPYAVATAVDRGTLHRVRMARLLCAGRMTSELGDIPTILDRVAAGQDAPVESSR